MRRWAAFILGLMCFALLAHGVTSPAPKRRQTVALPTPKAAKSKFHQRQVYRLSSAESHYLRSLLNQCEDGNGQSCFNYGRTVMQFDRPGDRRTGISYIRRACMMAYTPACNRPSPAEKAKIVGTASTGSSRCGSSGEKMIGLAPIRSATQSGPAQQITRLERGSILDRAGLKTGDVITKVNGSDISSAAEVSAALDRGKVLLEINRAGAILPLAIYCP